MIVAVVLALLAAPAPAPAPAAVTVSPSSVPADGEQQVVVKVARPGMVHIAVKSGVGVSCTLVDHLRGPFLDAGERGRTDCVVDALLDAGIYKLRLHAPMGGKAAPAATVTATPLSSIDVETGSTPHPFASAPLLLRRHESTTVQVPPGRQVVRWLKIFEREELTLDVVGRSVGVVKLWRNGAFVEDVAMTSTIVVGESGHPRWRHHIQTPVDAGEYALVAYGANPQAFTSGADDDTTFIQWDSAMLPESNTTEVVLPPWGFVVLASPHSTAAIEVAGTPGADLRLVGTAVVRSGNTVARGYRTAECVVSSATTKRGCVAALDRESDQVGVSWEVRGAAGTRVRLVAMPDAAGDRLPAVSSSTEPTFKLSSSTTDLGISSLPVDVDSAPLSCALEALNNDNDNNPRLVAVDAPRIGWTQAWQRRFNVDGSGTTLWFLIERAGVYSINTDARLGAHCDVFTMSNGRRHVDGTGSGICSARVPLPAGLIEVSLSGSQPGIEQFRIGQTGLASLLGNEGAAPPRTACTFSTSGSSPTLKSTLPAGRYRIRTTRSTSTDALASLLVVHDLTTNTPSMATLVTVDPGQTVRVPLSPGPSVKLYAMGGAGLPRCTGCNSDNVVPQRMSAVTVELTNTSSAPQPVVVTRLPSPTPAGAPMSFEPSAPSLSSASAAWFDLSVDTPRTFAVDVERDGLYDIQTKGLLATSCKVRTPTIASLFAGSTNGRGRNCLVQAWLKPGRYIVDVAAEGRSAGRAALSVVKRASVDGGAMVLGDERFLTVPAGQLTTHRIDTKGDGMFHLAVSAGDAPLLCRLDDDDGWPLATVPHTCTQDVELHAGKHTLVVLPLTVDSARSLLLSVPTEDKVLSGNATHALTLNTPARAVLGADGKDRFRFVIGADVDVAISLSNGMLGRLRRQRDDGTPGDVESTIAPVGGVSFGMASEEGSEASEGEVVDDSGEEGEGDSDPVEGMNTWDTVGEYGEAVRDEREYSRAMVQAATVHQTVTMPAGQVVSLAAGTWLLDTEHSRGDVGVGYTVSVGTNILVPGVAMKLRAPAVLDVETPAGEQTGLMRLRTRGATDVACRLVDDRGTLVARSQSSGDDWNCALAVPLAPGTHHRLFIDAEVLRPGPTEVTAEFLAAKSTGTLKSGDTFRVVGKVARADVVPVANQVTSIELTASDGSFSCALFDHDGRVLDSALNVRRCPLLAWPRDDVRPFSLLLWTADRPASIKARVQQQSPSTLGGLLDRGSVNDSRVAEGIIVAAGRYTTAANARCLPRQRRGALLPCANTVDVDPTRDGKSLLLAVPLGESANVDFAEVAHDIERSTPVRLRLHDGERVERQHTSQPQLHLVEVAGIAGTPRCGLDGGPRVIEGERCFAASNVGTDSLLRLWTKPGSTLDVEIRRRGVSLPSATTKLPEGTATIAGTARFALPDAPFRLDAALPATAWGVFVDASGKSLAVCGPGGADHRSSLRRCVVRGRGGSLVVVGEGRARFDVLRFSSTDDEPRLLSGLHETTARSAGRTRLLLPKTDAARLLFVEGEAVRGCRVIYDDGDAIEGCQQAVDAGRGGELVVEFDKGGWRAAIGAATTLIDARLRTLPTASEAMPTGLVVPLSSTLFARRLDLKAPAVVRVRATSGVCGVVTGGHTVAVEGTGDGCDLPVTLKAGTHTVVVRGFATSSLTGTVAVGVDGITTLAEGVGDEVLVLPGEARVLRIPLANDGELGIGIQVDAEVLACSLLDGNGAVVAEGCQIFGRYKKGDYLLRVSVDDHGGPRRFRPVVFGLQGAALDVPDAFLQDFFRRVPRPVASTSPTASSEVR